LVFVPLRLMRLVQLVALFGCLPIWLFAQDTINHWETVVAADDIWSYRLGDSAPPIDWMLPEFDAADWNVGIGGIGYGDGDDGTVISPVPSVFMRIEFEISSISNIRMAVLHADYDDAFVAYLNGMEIGRGNIGDPIQVLAFDESPPTDQEAVLYAGGLPEAFALYSDDLAQLLQMGQNTLAIQVNNFGQFSSDLSSNFFLSLAIADDSEDYQPTPEWFYQPFISTELPLIHIRTSDQHILNDPRIVAQMRVIDHEGNQTNFPDGAGTDYDGNIAIEIRGESSQFFEKKNYGFETQDEFGENNNVSLLGMPVENDWILHGPYSDKSLIRNALTFEIGNDLMDYASRTRFCELVINNQYEGVYLLMEKIKQDGNRVDIATLQPEDLEGDELTGGYIIEIDRDNVEVEGEGWYSAFEPYPFYTFHDPGADQLMQEQKEYIQNWVSNFELAMALPSYDFTYQSLLDVDAFIDYFLINEMAKHVDAFKLSFYMHKQKDSDGGKLVMGPIWDFNLGYSNFDFACDPSPQGWIYECTSFVFWVERLLQIEAIQDQMYCRWQQLRTSELDSEFLLSRIDSLVNFIGPAVERNFSRFPILGEVIWPNLFVGETYQEEIDFLKNWLVQRLIWMDFNMFGNSSANCSEILTLQEDLKELDFEVFPNPFSDQLNITCSRNELSGGEMIIYDALGRFMHKLEIVGCTKVNLERFDSGVYVYHYWVNDRLVRSGKLIKE